MQINRVQSPSFGKLMIHPKAQEKLKALPYRTMLEIQETYKELANTDFYHLYIGEDLKLKMVSKPNAYFGEFRSPHYDTKYDSYKMGPNTLTISDNSKHALFSQYSIIKGKKEKDELVRYNIRVYNRADGIVESLNNINEDLGTLTALVKDFDKAAKTNKTGIVVIKTPQQVNAKIERMVKDLMKSCSTRKEI